MADEGLMTIEELAGLAGVPTSTVRMYQSRGLPPPERHGRVGYYGRGHLARLRLIAQLQEQGFSLASMKRLIDAWESGRGLDDVLGLETQVAATGAPDDPVRLEPAQFAELFSGQAITPAVVERAVRMGLVAFDGGRIMVRNPRFLEIGTQLTRIGIPVEEILDELRDPPVHGGFHRRALHQGLRAPHVEPVRRSRPSGGSGPPADRVLATPQRLGRGRYGGNAPRRPSPEGGRLPRRAGLASRRSRGPRRAVDL
jgi:DNA-binding transcriptional MerR regulator